MSGWNEAGSTTAARGKTGDADACWHVVPYGWIPVRGQKKKGSPTTQHASTHPPSHSLGIQIPPVLPRKALAETLHHLPDLTVGVAGVSAWGWRTGLLMPSTSTATCSGCRSAQCCLWHGRRGEQDRPRHRRCASTPERCRCTKRQHAHAPPRSLPRHCVEPSGIATGTPRPQASQACP